MKELMKIVVSVGGLFLVMCLVSCASTPRTKWTDKTMRVMLDPDSIKAKHHVRIQQALVASGKWTVVDRSSGFEAIKKEQEQLYLENGDRYNDQEKWAHWGKLYGVGGIVIAKAQCVKKQRWFSGSKYTHCLQHLAIIDSNTGEVIAAVQAQSSGESGEANIAPSWEDAVIALNDAYPENYQPDKSHKKLVNYRRLSKERAIRRKEKRVRRKRNIARRAAKKRKRRPMFKVTITSEDMRKNKKE